MYVCMYAIARTHRLFACGDLAGYHNVIMVRHSHHRPLEHAYNVKRKLFCIPPCGWVRKYKVGAKPKVGARDPKDPP